MSSVIDPVDYDTDDWSLFNTNNGNRKIDMSDLGCIDFFTKQNIEMCGR